MDWGLVDLRTDPNVLGNVSMDTTQRRGILDAVLTVLSTAGAEAGDILSQFSPEPVMWEVPPILGTAINGVDRMSPSIFPASMSAGNIVEGYKKGLAAVRDLGLNKETRDLIAIYWGNRIKSKLAFSDTAPGLRAAAIFACETAVSMSYGSISSIFSPSELRTSRSLGVNVSAVFGADKKGIVGYTKIPVDMQDMYDHVTAPRGAIIYDTFDVLDQILLWVRANSDKLNAPDETSKALAILKMQQSPTFAYMVQQKVFKNKPLTDQDPSLRALNYSMEALDMIRDLWDVEEGTKKEKFTNLYFSIVPTYMDDDEFLEMFGSQPMPMADWDFTQRNQEQVSKGLERFITKFLTVQRAIRKGKDVRL